MKKEISPEEKLFNAIQEGKKTPPRPAAEKKKEAGGMDFWQRIIGGKSASPSTSGQTAFTAGQGSQSLNINLKYVNALLVIILGFLIAGVGYEIVYERPTLTKVEDVARKNNVPAAFELSPVEEFKPIDTYLEEVKKKDVFHPPMPIEPVPVQEVKPVEVGPGLKDMMKNLSLAGIYEGKDLEAMIEDKELKKTYFVKEGDEFKGIKVKSILKDRVVLQLGTQEADLL